jgi:gas vesicle protein
LSGFSDDVISGVIGAVTGGIAGSLTAWLVAPTQAEREERGKRRLEGKARIAKAVSQLNYQMMEARGALFRLENASEFLGRTQFLEFAEALEQNSMFLHWSSRIRVKTRGRKLTGRLIWRLAELVPPEHFAKVDDASVRQATADTRTSADRKMFGLALTQSLPTDQMWDEAFKILAKMRRSYPA